MTEATGAGVAASAGAAELTGGVDGAGGGAGGGGAAPEWLGGLPDELKGDATLSRYRSVEELARGHIETKRLASSRLAVPGEAATDEDWGKTWKALGLPDAPDGYGDFGLDALPADAGDDLKAARDGMVKGYQEQLHKLGVPPKLAGALVKADIARIEEAQAAYYAKGDEEVTALKKELGAEYEPQKAAARATFLKIFGDEAVAIADQLDTKVGSGLLLRGMMKLAKMTGEHGRIEGDGDGGGFGAGGGDAQAQINSLFADKGWREKFNANDAGAVAQFEGLRKAAHAAAAKNGI